MAKEFVRKILNVSTIQNLRDWTNCLGDIILKDGIYAYIRVEGEYKPISFPMIYDYNLPPEKWVHSDFYTDKDGVHGLDRLDNTSKKYDLTDEQIIYLDKIFDSVNNITNYYKTTINKNRVITTYGSDKNVFNESLTPYYYERSISVKDNNDTSILSENINSTYYRGNLNTRNIVLIRTATDTIDYQLNTNYSKYSIECTSKTEELTATVAQYGLQATIKENSLRVIHLAQNSSYIENLTNNNLRFSLLLQNNNLIFNYLNDGNVKFNISGDNNSIQAYANAYDRLLGLTDKINNLQNQINNLSNRISSLEK